MLLCFRASESTPSIALATRLLSLFPFFLFDDDDSTTGRPAPRSVSPSGRLDVDVLLTVELRRRDRDAPVNEECRRNGTGGPLEERGASSAMVSLRDMVFNGLTAGSRPVPMSLKGVVEATEDANAS